MLGFTEIRGTTKYKYLPLKNRIGRPYAWSEKNFKTGKTKRISWNKFVIIFTKYQDRLRAKQRAKLNHTSYSSELKKIKTARNTGDFAGLY